jgi:AcrR family transcriptional regulator
LRHEKENPIIATVPRAIACDPEMARAEPARTVTEPVWRQRAVSRSLRAARSRAEQRVQRFLDAAFDLIDEKGTTEFTIQEVVDRSKQSLRGFYQYFDGKDELLLALFEETVRESVEDLRTVADSESKPLDRLRAFTIRLHEWCEPPGTPRKRGKHNRRPISEFSLQLAMSHPERVTAAMAPIWRILLELLDGAVAAGVVKISDTRRTALLLQQTVMYSWLGNRLVQNPQIRVSAEETWAFCLRGLQG